MLTLLVLSLIRVTLAVAAPGILNIGDSTVTGDAGWGQGFRADTVGFARCINLSVSGTTTVWQSQPQYQSMLTACKNMNTFASIQFGHNDQKAMDTATFASNLESLTQKTMNASCSPMLVTSLCRRTFSGGTLTDILEPDSNQTIAVANRLNFPLLLLLADCRSYIQKLGEAQSDQFNWDHNTTNKDATHLNPLGALYFGRMVADKVKKLYWRLRPISRLIQDFRPRSPQGRCSRLSERGLDDPIRSYT